MDLLDLAKTTVVLALSELNKLAVKNKKKYTFSDIVPREMKAEADLIIEEILIDNLSKSGLGILSEERGFIKPSTKTNFKFIIDPIDGTVNFVRDIGKCSVSVALFDGKKPIFGVLGSYPDNLIAWVGRGIGAFLDNQPIKVSAISDPKQGVLCTGFPSRFEFNEDANVRQMNFMQKFGKVRMLGSASQSLLKLAQGSIDIYMESNIMIWDIAAGVAIVEGAGGKVILRELTEKSQFSVQATNNNINT